MIGSVRTLYEGLPTEEDLKSLGLAPEDCTEPNEQGVFYDTESKAWRCLIWADNWPVMQFYTNWSSQWRVVSGMSGVHYLGLDMGVMLQLLDRLGLSKDEYDDMLGCLREIEAEAKKHLNAA